MSFAYTIRESFSGFRRAKLSSLLSVATISISLILVGIFAAVTINASRLIDSLRSRLDMEAFLTEPVTEDDVAGLQSRIGSLEGVEKVDFVSKDEALRIFKKETGRRHHKGSRFQSASPVVQDHAQGTVQDVVENACHL